MNYDKLCLFLFYYGLLNITAGLIALLIDHVF